MLPTTAFGLTALRNDALERVHLARFLDDDALIDRACRELAQVESAADFLPMPARVGIVFAEGAELDFEREVVEVLILERAAQGEGLEWGYAIVEFGFDTFSLELTGARSIGWVHEGFSSNVMGGTCSLIQHDYLIAICEALDLAEEALINHRDELVREGD